MPYTPSTSWLQPLVAVATTCLLFNLVSAAEEPFTLTETLEVIEGVPGTSSLRTRSSSSSATLSTSSSSWVKQDRDERMRTSMVSPQTRITGGDVAKEGEYPWFVSSSGNLICGGSLVARDMVLTAAHCIAAFSVGDVVFVGKHNKLIKNDSSSERVIERMWQHPQYDPNQINKDFMMIKLDQPVEISPIPLNGDFNFPRAQQDVTVMGFGRTAENGPLSWQLRDADLKILDYASCSDNYRGVAAIDQVTPLVMDEDVMLCASSPVKGVSACMGDSGGPLVRNGVQVGLVSFGVGCGDRAFPGVYARVSAAYDWIHGMICRYSDAPGNSCSLSKGAVDGDEVGDTLSNTGGSSETRTLRLRFGYDVNPGETSWAFEQDGIINAAGPEVVPGSFSVVDYTFSGVLPGDYTFTVQDSKGDGLAFTFRFCEIWMTKSDGSEERLAVCDESFYWEFSVDLTVPAAI